MALILRRSNIHADGCYTTRVIKKGTRIVEYTGPRLTKESADGIYENSPRTYLFGLDDAVHVIDGDGVAAFINHSCAPNCEPDEIKQRVYIFAKRNIKAGEELAYDYNLYDGDPDDPAKCFCGVKKCRGSMYSEEELEKRKKERRRKKNPQKRQRKK
jgi:SET domain-containing protein